MKLLTGKRWTEVRPIKRAILVLVLLSIVSSPAQNMTPEQQQAMRTAQEIADQAKRIEVDNRWAEALPLRRKLVEVLSGAFGSESAQADQGRRTLADLLGMLGRYAEAREVLEQCLKARRTALGEQHELIADALLRIGETFRREGQLTNALETYGQAERIILELPDQWELRATIANNQALVLSAQGDLRGAEKRHLDALSALAKLPNARPTLVAPVLTSLGEIHRALGRTVEAEAEHLRALSLLSALPPENALRVVAENNLASVYRDQGRAPKAVEINERSIQVLTQQRGLDDLDVLSMRRNLARALATQVQHADALEIIDDCLNRLSRTQRTAHPLFLALQVDRADRLADLGDIVSARQAYASIIEQEKESRTNDFLVWASRERMAIMARDQGDLAAARSLFELVLDYRKQRAADGPRQQAELASTTLEWVRFERVLGRLDEADHRLTEVLQKVTQQLGAEHPLAAEMWTEAGFLARARGQPALALTNHQRAWRIHVQAYGDQSLLAAQSRINVADVLPGLDQQEVALREITAAHTTITNLAAVGSPLVVSVEFNLAGHLHRAGRLDEAARLYESVLAHMEHQHVRHASTVARDLAFLELERGQLDSARQHATKAFAKQEEIWRNVLRFASGYDRLAWQGANDVFSALASTARNDPLPLAQAVLRFKGAVLDSLIEDAQLANLRKETRDPVLSLSEARRERYRLEMTAGSKRRPASETLEAAREKVERLEADLARQAIALDYNRRAFMATVEGVCKTLLPNTALVEFVRYSHWLGQGKTEARIGALVFDRSAALRWVELGPVQGRKGIGQAVKEWRATIRQEKPPEADEVTAPLAALYDRVWSRLALPPNIRNVIVAPDGELNFVPFALLWINDHFLGEDLTFRYVTAGRDLLEPAYQQPQEKRVCILAAPGYSRSGWERRVAGPLRENWKALCDVLAFRGSTEQETISLYGDLPGTREEADLVAQLARQHGCESVRTFVGKDADEKALEQTCSPYLLHLATHGVFLGNPLVKSYSVPLSASPSARLVLPNPMYRSWLALARANETIQAWLSGQVPDPLRDGVLTAEEAAQLPLAGTWLVTLSACDTGLGVDQAGEGVFGLRRGFALAGARHVLMTLWPVNDERTREFMKEFYADALQSGDAPGALGRVQQRLLAQWRKTEGAGRAARFAGAFIISSRGP